MCGITGFVDTLASTRYETMAVHAARMTATLLRRGPDDSGTWVDAGAGVARGHRRLAVLDLSNDGHPPMVSASGRFVLVYNGEIYNFRELRAELENSVPRFAFRGRSDTEVMLAALDRWGIERSLQAFHGMFAFGVWDREDRCLHLACDRLGEKPLFYGSFGRFFAFASELKALLAHPAFPAEIDRDALALYLRHGYVPAPYSIYRGIRKLEPGTWITLSSKGVVTPPAAYWSLHEVAEAGARNPFRGTPDEAVSDLAKVIGEAVRSRLVADVPVGAFLSGGVDSSTVVALMQKFSPRPVRTFTVGFREGDYDETRYAREVARTLGTEHTELYVTPSEARSVIPRLPMVYDEPFADSSQIPTLLVAKLARRHVTVALSGDGGDELFRGYQRYSRCKLLWRTVGFMGPALRRVISRGIHAVPVGTWNGLARAFDPLFWHRLGDANVGDKLHKLAFVLRAASQQQMYLSLVSHWFEPSEVVLDAAEHLTMLSDPARWPGVAGLDSKMMFADTLSYLPNDILVKLDRACMSVGLESRAPLLDHRVVEFAWRLPVEFKRRNGQDKWVLRQVLHRYVPATHFRRPKSGFAVPISEWLRGPLREWAADLLDSNQLLRQRFFKPESVRQKWEEHLSGVHNWAHSLWTVLLFQAWLAEVRGCNESLQTDSIPWPVAVKV